MQPRRAPLAVTFLAMLWVAGLAAAQPAIAKVEPPNWWPGHTWNPVRVLMRGTALHGARVDAVGEGLSIGLVRVNAAGSYLFVDVEIASDAMPGARRLRVTTPSGTTDAPFEVSAPLPRGGRFQGFSPDDVIYLAMPDRFRDGDASNNDPPGSPGLFDRTRARYYHGGDLRGVIEKLPYLKDLGVTALWLNPWYDNVNHLNEKERYDDRPINDYHCYSPVDFYGF